MHMLMPLLQVIVALGLLNVWLVRAGRSTAYRGGGAKTMVEEFAAYGLPDWMRKLVGVLKIGAAIALLAGIWVPVLVAPTALLVSVLMLGALAMHVKIGDPIRKSVPAAIVLALCIVILLGTRAQ
ncbi:MAG: DoxX family protein [Gemmatimonadetes bacterium]|nr:DoxX family protein [Gemmatimonadota bacterium]MCC6770213.1 DoxX family protein [Gemmatimonadaceae bacterium]